MAVIKLNEMAAPTGNYKNQAVGWVCLEAYNRLEDSGVKITRTNDTPGQALQKFKMFLARFILLLKIIKMCVLFVVRITLTRP